MTYMDHHIGELLNLLEELEIEDRTLVILVADHGESMTEKSIYFSHAGLFNPVTHVPLIMRFPGRISPGTEVTAMTSSVDIVPTVLDLLGFEPPAVRSDGRSLVPTLSDPDYEPHEFVIVEAVNGIIGALYRSGYKYIKPYGNDWAVKEDHLFRAFEDTAEEKDLKTTEPEQARQMESFLDAWLDEAKQNTLPSTRRTNLDKMTADALKALGYIK
jgi:arylsulfatase A-like enzyme